MKKYLSLVFLLLSTLIFSQDAFNDTKILINYEALLERNDLRELIDVYVEKTDFDSIQKMEIEQVLLFIENPFRFNSAVIKSVSFQDFGILLLLQYLSHATLTLCLVV